ncbi:MAG: type I methionyl aminopeptidase, partial [Chloroflexota bacterium]
AVTFPVGEVDSESRRLMDVCQASLDAGIAQASAGNRLTDIAAATQEVVERAGFSVVRDLYAHGVGRRLHEAPTFPHYGRPGRGPRLETGMVITIEPMIVAGNNDVEVLDDGWTIVTRDGSRSAQFEHTVAITENGADILTLP